MQESRLKTSLDTLTASFVESVMNAIRLASLEELVGRAPRSSAADDARLAPAQVRQARPRRQPRERQRPAPPRGRARPSAAPSILPALPALLEDVSTAPEPASEITDPQMLLALGMPDVVVSIPEPHDAVPLQSNTPQGRAAYTNGEARPMRLRENESLARVSGAGVVIRRAR